MPLNVISALLQKQHVIMLKIESTCKIATHELQKSRLVAKVSQLTALRLYSSSPSSSSLLIVVPSPAPCLPPRFSVVFPAPAFPLPSFYSLSSQLLLVVVLAPAPRLPSSCLSSSSLLLAANCFCSSQLLLTTPASAPKFQVGSVAKCSSDNVASTDRRVHKQCCSVIGTCSLKF